jgi:hypothetical protein
VISNDPGPPTVSVLETAQQLNALASTGGPVSDPILAIAEVLGVVQAPGVLPVALAAVDPAPVVEPPLQLAQQTTAQPQVVAPVAPAVPPQTVLPPQPPRVIKNVFDQVPGLGDLSTNLGVIGTNILLAIIALLCLLVATTIFNSTIKENADTVAVNSRFARAWSIVHLGDLSLEDLPRPLARTLISMQPVFLLAATGIIYGALDPNFGWNESSLVLFIGLIAGITLTTFLFEGGQILFAAKSFHEDAKLQLFPVALAIAAISVFLTRVTAFHPGVIFGFVGSAVITASSRKREGMIVWIPLVGLFLVSLVALALITPLREWSANRTDVWATIPETIAIAVFVGGGQSVLLTLLPMTFNDGAKVWEWSRLAWFALALPAAFIFFHALINPDAGYADIAQESRPMIMLGICVAILAASIVVWFYVRIREGRMREAEVEA